MKTKNDLEKTVKTSSGMALNGQRRLSGSIGGINAPAFAAALSGLVAMGAAEEARADASDVPQPAHTDHATQDDDTAYEQVSEPVMVGTAANQSRASAADTLELVQQYACSHEDPRLNPAHHEVEDPTDRYDCLRDTELERARTMNDAYDGLFNQDIEALYQLSAGSGNTRAPDPRVALHAQGAIGLTPVGIALESCGLPLPQFLDEWVYDRNPSCLRPHAAFANADPAIKPFIVQNMQAAAAAMGSDAARVEDGHYRIAPEIVLAGVEALVGLAGAQPPAPTPPPLPTPPSPPTPPRVPAPTPEPTYQCSDRNDNDGDGWIDLDDFQCGNNPNWDNEAQGEVTYTQPPVPTPPVPTPEVTHQCSDGIDNDNDGWTDLDDAQCSNNPAWDNEAVAEAVVQPPTPTPPTPPAPAADPCAPEQFAASLDNVRAAYEQRMQRDEPVALINDSAEASYDALEGQCPQNSARVEEARNALLDASARYVCEDPRFARYLDAVRAGAEERMSNHDDAEDINDEAQQGYTNLSGNCPQNASRISAARANLAQRLAEYIVAEAERIRLRLADFGGGYMTGGRVDHTGDGHLLLRFANDPSAESPFNMEAYLDGGNYFARDTGRPFGGAIVNFGGKKYQVRLSLAGRWLAQQSESAVGPTTTTTTTPIEDGTETQVSTTSEWNDSTTEGYFLNSWQSAAEALINLGDFKLTLSVGYGEYRHHQRDTSNVDTHTDQDIDTSTPGDPASGTPAVRVHTDATTDVSVDTSTLTDILSQLISFKAGLVYQHDSEWSYGADVTGFIDLNSVEGRTDVDITTTMGETVTTVDVEGFPIDVVRVPGSGPTTLPTDSTPFDYDQDQLRFVVRGRLHYDTSDAALRLDPGLVFGWNQGEASWGSMPVSCVGAALFDVNDMTLGVNSTFDGNRGNLDLLLNTDGRFPRAVEYNDVGNDLAIGSIMDERLRDSYLDALKRIYVLTNNGFLANVGVRVDGQGDVSGHGLLAYTHQFGWGPLGGRVEGDSEDMRLKAALFAGIPGGLYVEAVGRTEDDPIAGERVWGLGANAGYSFELANQSDDEEDEN